MAVNPCFRWADGDQIDYTPVSAVVAGQVVVQGNLVGIASLDIAAAAPGALNVRGVFQAPKDASIFAAGDPVYWNPTGTPLSGTAASGCATSTAAGNNRMGFATLAQLTGDNYVFVELVPMTTSPGGIQTGTVAAAGSTQADAAPIPLGFTLVTAADATKGVLLPVAPAGSVCEIKNGDAANAVLKVWPSGTNTINAIAASTNIAMAAKTSAIFRNYNGTAWYTIPLVPS